MSNRQLVPVSIGPVEVTLVFLSPGAGPNTVLARGLGHASGDPALNQVDFILRQGRSQKGHAGEALTAQSEHQLTCVGIARKEDRSPLAASKGGGVAVKPQAPGCPEFGMAHVAPSDEDHACIVPVRREMAFRTGRLSHGLQDQCNQSYGPLHEQSPAMDFRRLANDTRRSGRMGRSSCMHDTLVRNAFAGHRPDR